MTTEEIFNKPTISVGDKVIANDEFIRGTGFIDGEIIEIIPYKAGSRLSNEPNYENNKFGVTILGKFKKRDFITDSLYEEISRIHSCDFALNPIYDVNTRWVNYNGYAKALFFTSQEIKDKFNELIRIKNMNYHLNAAKSYGYKPE
jgi:hypothetical protein